MRLEKGIFCTGLLVLLLAFSQPVRAENEVAGDFDESRIAGAGMDGQAEEPGGLVKVTSVKRSESAPEKVENARKTGGTLRLTMEKAMKMAYDNNLEVRSAQLTIQAADQGVKAAWGGLGPRVSISAAFNFMGGDSAFDGESGSAFCDDFTDPNCLNQMLVMMCGTADISDECVQFLGTSQGRNTARIVANTLGASMAGFGSLSKIFQANTFNPSVTAVWPIFNAMSWLGIKQARLGREMSRIQAKDKVQDVGLQVQVAFLQTLQFEELKALAENSAKSTMAHWKQAKALLDAGDGTTTDVLRWETQIEQDKLNIMKMKLGVRQLKMMLNNLLGRRLTAGLELVPPTQVKGSLPKSDSIDIREVEHDPRLRLARAATDGKHLEYRMAQSRFLPTLTLTANYQWQRYIQYLDVVPDRWLGSWMVGLNLNIPLFDSFTDYHSVKSKSYELSRSRIEEENLRRILRHQAYSARTDLVSARQQVETAAKQVELAEEAHKSAENLYEAGAARTTDLLDAQIQERQARGNLINAKYDYLIALSRLERAVGKVRIGK